jgi:ATP-dependent RNA helicase DDX31/DBP7
MHGNVPHSERALTMSKFSSSSSCVLLATDVAARGLNLPGANWIVQYDPPSETADYIHRAGRAARAGRAGNALLFLLPSESKYLDVLKVKGLKGMGMMGLEKVLEEGAKACREVTREGLKKASGGSRNDGEAFATSIQIR